MLSIITLPSASTTIDSLSTWSGAYFTEFLPLLALVGIPIAAMLLVRLYKSIKGGASMALGAKRGGKRRRR